MVEMNFDPQHVVDAFVRQFVQEQARQNTGNIETFKALALAHYHTDTSTSAKVAQERKVVDGLSSVLDEVALAANFQS